jgi:hypothetical protein
MTALEQTCTRQPNPQAAWIHHIHAAGGTGSSNTMVAVFIGLVVCCGWSRDVTSSSYVKNGTKNNLKMRLTVLLFVPHWCTLHQQLTLSCPGCPLGVIYLYSTLHVIYIL